jgi:hypothetical protein
MKKYWSMQLSFLKARPCASLTRKTASFWTSAASKAPGKQSNVQDDLFNQPPKKNQIEPKSCQSEEFPIHQIFTCGERRSIRVATRLVSCELILTENPQHLQKDFDPQSGIAQIRV